MLRVCEQVADGLRIGLVKKGAILQWQKYM